MASIGVLLPDRPEQTWEVRVLEALERIAAALEALVRTTRA